VNRTTTRGFASILVALLACAALSQTKRPLKPDEYGQWEQLRGTRISADGHWLAAWVGQVDADGYVFIRNVDSPERWVVPVGSMPSFSDDSKWCAYMIGVPKKDADKMREQKQPVENKLGVRELSSGQEQVFESVQSFRFLKGGRFLLVHHNRGADKQSGGSDLDVVDLSDGSMVPIGNVVSYVPNEAENLIALAIGSDSKNSGVQIFDPAKSSLKTLIWGKNDMANLTWARKADVVGFMVGRRDEKKDGAWYRVMLVSDLMSSKPAVKAFDPKGADGFPEGKRITDFGGLTLNDDGTAAAFGIRGWDDVKRPQGKPEEKAQVDVWSTKDIYIQPQQKKRADMEKRQTLLCVWTPNDNRFIQVADEKARNAQLARDFKHALVIDETPYRKSVSTGVYGRDVYLVDLSNGTREKLLSNVRWPASLSSTGKYAPWFSKGQWTIIDLDTKVRYEVTKGLPTKFEDVENDGTIPEKPAEQGATWAEGDAGVFLFDRFDTYVWTPGSSQARKITDGAKEGIVFRPVDVVADDEAIRLDRPIYFSMFGDATKNSGYALMQPGQAPKPLIFEERSVTSISKAKDVDRMTFLVQRFHESPTVMVTNGLFTQAKPILKTNAQQENFAWGKTELVHFKSKWGKPLQGTLIYPADYEPGKKYPMVVYIYERLSNGLNNYVPPTNFNAYNEQAFSQNGYFVFRPDIAYRGRQPGISALECLEPAVQEVLKKGVVDPAKVGLMGHSWGAYQTTLVISKSKMFSAAVAGAPLTNLISMYGSIYWNSGTPDQELMETGQGRLEVPYWEDLKTYMDNSALFNAKNITTPLLIAFGDQDGAVDWHQGQELYTTMRRMGKDITMLVYADENHNYTKRPDQMDYAQRVRHFFDVNLKGAKPEPWLSEGVPFLKKDGG
jgi:dienelactone hydrolase